jgi:hypothetical protein
MIAEWLDDRHDAPTARRRRRAQLQIVRPSTPPGAVGWGCRGGRVQRLTLL